MLVLNLLLNHTIYDQSVRFTLITLQLLLYNVMVFKTPVYFSDQQRRKWLYKHNHSIDLDSLFFFIIYLFLRIIQNLVSIKNKNMETHKNIIKIKICKWTF
jgi:hypothetical protein